VAQPGRIVDGEWLDQRLPSGEPVSGESSQSRECVGWEARARMPLNDVPNGIEHVFPTAAHAAIEQSAPFLTGEWLLAPGAGFADVTALCGDDTVAIASAHDRRREIAGNDDNRVFDASLRMRRKQQFAMHRRIGIMINGSVDVVLRVAAKVRWKLCGGQRTTILCRGAHAEYYPAAAVVGDSDRCFGERGLPCIVGKGQPALIFDGKRLIRRL
jgi:hypothetical protein